MKSLKDLWNDFWDHIYGVCRCHKCDKTVNIEDMCTGWRFRSGHWLCPDCSNEKKA